MSDTESVPINADQILLRGSSLRNTEWVIGIAIYTGHDTKIMKNSPSARSKKSSVEVKTNRFIIYTVILQVMLCLIGAIYSTVWEMKRGNNHWYMELNTDKKSFIIDLVFTPLWNFIGMSSSSKLSLGSRSLPSLSLRPMVLHPPV